MTILCVIIICQGLALGKTHKSMFQCITSSGRYGVEGFGSQAVLKNTFKRIDFFFIILNQAFNQNAVQTFSGMHFDSNF